MTVTAPLALAKPIAKGEGVSYGHHWVADEATTVGLVPAGYGDGVPRHGSNVLEVAVDGVRRPVRGRVCMDQVVVDLGGDLPPVGTPSPSSAPVTTGAHRSGLGRGLRDDLLRDRHQHRWPLQRGTST